MNDPGMTMADALRVLAALRREEVVVTTMGAAREWPRLSQHPLDLHYIPSAMGHAPSLALGLALSCPQRQVIVLNGDGCMLMSIGALVTAKASRATNVTLIVLDNGRYEVTGGQHTAAAVAGCDYAALARAARWPSVYTFSALEPWQAEAAQVLAAPGPRFVHLRVQPTTADFQLPTMRPLPERLSELRQALVARQAP